MNIQKLTEDVLAVHRIYLTSKGLDADPGWYVMKLSEELGELTQAYLRRAYSRTASPADVDTTSRALADECADLLCHVLLFAAKNDVDMVEAVRRKWLSYLDKP